MSDLKRSASQPDNEEETPRRGPNLTLYYGLIVLAMLVALAIAAFIVLPFYHRH